jgi:hypothetical protein
MHSLKRVLSSCTTMVVAGCRVPQVSLLRPGIAACIGG